MTTKPIGSEFDLSLHKLLQKKFYLSLPNAQSHVMLSSGRDALTYITELLDISNNKKIALPSYLCPEMLTPFHDKGIEVLFYAVDEHLKVNLADIQRLLKDEPQVAALLVIHYFGFPQDITQIKKLCDRAGIALIEDCAQACFSTYRGKQLGCFGDYSFTSYRKFLPVPDGAMLIFRTVPRKKIRLYKSLRHACFVWLRFAALLIKNLRLRFQFLPNFFLKQSFDFADRFIDYKKPASMSWIGRWLLAKSPIKEITSARRENFSYLLKHLPHNAHIKPLFTTLPEGVCPLGFPIVVSNRDAIKQKLIANNIFPPIHWNLTEAVDHKQYNKSWKLSLHIITLPIDQRYNIQDMERMLKCLVA